MSMCLDSTVDSASTETYEQPPERSPGPGGLVGRELRIGLQPLYCCIPDDAMLTGTRPSYHASFEFCGTVRADLSFELHCEYRPTAADLILQGNLSLCRFGEPGQPPDTADGTSHGIWRGRISREAARRMGFGFVLEVVLSYVADGHLVRLPLRLSGLPCAEGFPNDLFTAAAERRLLTNLWGGACERCRPKAAAEAAAIA